MKSFFSTLLILISFSAQAYYFDASNSWEEIFNSKRAVFFFEENLGGIKLANACLTDSEIRSIEPMSYCLKLVPIKAGENKDRFIDWQCEKWIVGNYAYPRFTKKQICTELVNDQDQNLICKKFEELTVHVADTIKVAIAVEDRGLVGFPYISKSYTFPVCRK